MTNLEALNVYQSYVGAWKPIPDAQRKSILSEVFDESVEYLAPYLRRWRQCSNRRHGALPEAVSWHPLRHRKRLHASRGCAVQVGAHSAGRKGHGERPRLHSLLTCWENRKLAHVWSGVPEVITSKPVAKLLRALSFARDLQSCVQHGPPVGSHLRRTISGSIDFRCSSSSERSFFFKAFETELFSSAISACPLSSNSTFEVFPGVGPDNSLEGLTERSVGLITDRPGNVHELFITLFE